jgi:hypothetical protein
MKEFMMIFRHEINETAVKPTEEQMREEIQKWQKWIRGIAERGNYSSTNRLLSEGKTLKSLEVISDGPYAEAKEMIGGYLNVKTNTLEEAVELAKSCPGLQNGATVEIRSIMPIEYDPKSPNFLI